MKDKMNNFESAIELLEALKTMTSDEQKLVLMLIKGYSAGIKVKNANVGTV